MDATRLLACTALLMTSPATAATADTVKVGVLERGGPVFIGPSAALRERTDIPEHAVGLKKTGGAAGPCGPMH